jgi:hypothetical protein
MTCEEFEAIGLERLGKLTAADAAFAEAAAHANVCSRCAALQESWQEARAGLQVLRAATRDAETPQRVEMRLRQEFRTTHRTSRMRFAAVFSVWALATAAVLVGAVSWWNWRLAQSGQRAISAGNIVNPGATTPGVGANSAGNVGDSAEEPTLIADNAGDFTLLPGSLLQETDDSAIVRVRMQRGALGALGLPVNEERVSDWIQVDLLVGQDGQPKAVRLPE